MRANELRIGNLVAYGVHPVPIKSIHTESVLKKEVHVYVELNENLNYYCIDVLEVKPIPLTEEWLLKFGFIKSSDNNYYKGDKFTIYNRFENFGLIGGLLSWKEFKYVHQLQNLYFALTGEELTYGGNK